MPSMANARFAALVVAIFGTHVAATNLVKLTDRDAHSLVERKQEITPQEPVTALLVGGSGMHYGLNARVLSEETPYNFLNLGLILEGNSWPNYLGFLDSLGMIDTEKIEVVIYSSSDFYDLHESDEFTLEGARAGALLFDQQSWLQKLKPDANPYGSHKVDRTVIDPETGDMIFLDGVCDIYKPPGRLPPFGKSIDVITARAGDLAKRFPNAEVLLRPWPFSEYDGPDLGKVHLAMRGEFAKRGFRTMIPPEALYDPVWACDAAFHPNAEGRDLLTQQEVGVLRALLGAARR